MIVRTNRLLAVLLLLLGAFVSWAAEHAAESESRLRQTVTYLASDELEGRGVGTSGLDKAADYIAAQFQQMGLRTDLFNGGPFQEFEIPLSPEMGPPEHNRLSLLGSPAAGGDARRVELQ